MSIFSIPKHLKNQYAILCCFLIVVGLGAFWLIDKPLIPYISITLIAFGIILIIFAILSLLKNEHYENLIKSMNSSLNTQLDSMKSSLNSQSDLINILSSQLKDSYKIRDYMVKQAINLTFGGESNGGYKPTVAQKHEPTVP